MKPRRAFAVVLLIAIVISTLSLSACSEPTDPEGELSITDSEGNTFALPKNPRVASAYGSYAECWLLSGGSLVGATEDAISQRGLELDENVKVIGTVKSVNLELLISLSPDLVILSADLTAHRQLAAELSDRGIAAALFRVDSFADYDRMMHAFCELNGGEAQYQKHVVEVKASIDNLLSSVPTNADNEKTVLVVRAYSGGIKVKTDNTAEDIAKELGCVSLAEKYPSMLTDLSLEAIIESDPDFIFVLTMGDEGEATDTLEEFMSSNPAFSSLSAVREGRLHLLPKELFHYKPNNKWYESYEFLAKIIYPEIFK